MNELIKVEYSNDTPTVLARDLHAALEVETPYHKWFPRMCEYGFGEGRDYMTVDKNVRRADGTEMPQIQHDHQITLSMAKELCMLQRSEKGKQFRQYFISVEEAWNRPEAVMARALQMANRKMEELKQSNSELTVQNAIMAPKAEYFDQLVERNLLTNFRETAKQMKIGQQKLVDFLLTGKYLYRDKKNKLQPYQRHVDGGLFEVKECFNEKTDWCGTQTLITPKGRETFRLLIMG